VIIKYLLQEATKSGEVDKSHKKFGLAG
jgi:hypothetical protein